MAALDPKVASVVDRATRDDDSDEDALIAALEEDDSDLDAFREQRLQQLHAEFDKARRLKANEHGTYTEIKDEKALMDITTSTKLCVVHFFKPDFNRCRIMDTHLESLAPSHYEARIMKINVDNCPFLVTKLGIQVLPCVLAFIDGVGVDRIIGFEGLGRSPDNFASRDLEARLIRAEVFARNKVTDEDERQRLQKSKARRDEEEHEASERKERDGDSQKTTKRKDEEERGENEGCHPMDPSSRIKELTKRIVEDHNRDQKDKVRRAYLDPKGREYTTRPWHWGSKDPFVPAEAASTRAGYEWQSSADECRIEKELRVMLQMWYRSKLSREERGKDRTSEGAKEEWKKKMEIKKKERKHEARFNEYGEMVGGDHPVVWKQVEVDGKERFSTTTKEEKDPAAMTREEKAKAKGTAETDAPSKIKKLFKDPSKAVEETRLRQPGVCESDESDNTKILKKPTSKQNTRTHVIDDGDRLCRASTRPSQAVRESQELTDEQLASFEQWANAVDANEKNDTTLAEETNSLKSQPVPQKRASVVETTERERKLLDAMKQKAAEDVQSEDEPESEQEAGSEEEREEEESEDEESPVERPRADAKAKTEESAFRKTNEATPFPSSPSSVHKSSSPESKSTASTPSNSMTPKRKASTPSTADVPASKKVCKYKSAYIIEDSDDEADYALSAPSSPKLDVSEQREGWALAETAVPETESVKVVQTDYINDEDVQKKGEVVVERGTTIVTTSESATPNESGVASAPPEEALSSSSIDSLFGDKSATIPAEDTDAQGEQEYPNIVDGNTSDLDGSSLSDPPSSAPSANDETGLLKSGLLKRRSPFRDDGDGQENVQPAKKARKSVRFDEEIYYAVERKRRMSIPYVLEEDEVEHVEVGEMVRSENAVNEESETAVSDEEGEVSE